MKRRLLFQLIYFFCSLGMTSEARGVHIEYMEASRFEILQKRFNEARELKTGDLKSLDHSRWTCDMYGMSSRLQKESGVKLYSFERDSEQALFQNKGAQVVKAYRHEGGFNGHKGSLEDQLRLSGQGQLISRLELHSLDGKASRLLAISVCDKL
jgi:hypothetical protein